VIVFKYLEFNVKQIIMTNGSNSTLYVLYGSATGNAEGISKDLTDELNENQNRLPLPFTKVVCQELNQFKKCLKEWKEKPSNAGQHKYGVLFVSSTTGNGDPPENAGRFIRYIRKQSKDKTGPKPFEHVAYAVLALGDTNYDQFCETGKVIDQKMEVLGGTRARKIACTDEGTGLMEEIIEPWIATIAQDMAKTCLASSSSTSSEEKDCSCDDDVSLSATVSNNKTSTTNPSSTTVNSTTETVVTATATASTVTAAPEKSPSPLYIMYGSATGNAEQIAKDLAATYQTILNNPDSKTYFQEVICAELNQFKKMKLMEKLCIQPAPGNDTVKHGLLVVASTTGNGDAPENSDRFLRYLKKTARTDERPLKHVDFAVLALGDTNYDQFCETGKMLNKYMKQLGGSPIRPLACADEGTGNLEEVVEGWTATILMDLTTSCRGESASDSTGVAVEKVTIATTTTTSASTKIVVKERKEVQEEEKKMESYDEMCQPSSTSPGVCLVRSMLSLTYPSEEVTSVEESTLPRSSLKSHTTLVEFIPENDANRDTAAIINDDDDDDQSEDGVRYTCAQPYESHIVGARYLTATSSGAADEICEVLAGCETSSFHEILDRRFPLEVENGVAEADRNGKRVIELSLAIPDDESWTYQPGDSLALLVNNTPGAVTFVLRMLQSHHGISPSQKVSIDGGVSLSVEEIVGEKIDLCTVIKSRKVLYALSQISNDPQEKAVLELLSSKTDKGDMLMETYIHAQRRSIIDILQEFPSCQTLTLQNLVSFLPPIPPRYYSVSSSPFDTGRSSKSLTVTFSVVDYLTPSLLSSSDGKELGLRRIHGVATRHLEELCSPFLSSSPFTVVDDDSASCLKIFPKPTDEFLMPAELSTPLVLIGPGTGIAPFMGFLAHRKALVAAASGLDVNSNEKSRIGSVEVFFGCRHAKHDYLYQEEMQAFENDGVIDHLHAAFSRDDPTGKKEYVQNLMTDHSERLVDTIIHGNGCVYVCGDGNHMARDVQATIAKLIGPHLKMKTATRTDQLEIGKAYIEVMKNEGRFLMDIWS